MAQIVITGPADSDIAAILLELGSAAGLHVASAYDTRFERLFDQLTAYPDSGPLRPALGFNIRIGIVSPYVVVYRHDAMEDVVKVLRVVHSSRRMSDELVSPM